MQRWLAEFCARLILATTFIDKSFRIYDRARSALVLALASEDVLKRYNSLAYHRDKSYQPDSSTFRSYLFPWEEKIIASYFPPPPARLLIGGAGGGREALALAERGYEVCAFEPSAPLAATLAEKVANERNVIVYRAGYEDMPQMFSARPGEASTSLEAQSGFDAAILGWSSFSHLRTEEQRIRTLSSFARYVQGVILISYFSLPDTRARPNERLRGPLRSLLSTGANQFSPYIGFFHKVSTSELTTLTKRAGLEILHLNEDSRDTNWPHAVLCPVELVRSRDHPSQKTCLNA